MLQLIRNFYQLNFRSLTEVYRETCQRNGGHNYPHQPLFQQLLMAEQDLYGETKCFFADPNAFYAVWEQDGRYMSALRMEPYKDGLLLEGLETAPDLRGNGYAKKLVLAVLSALSNESGLPVYSHIDKNNKASLAVHRACGFEKVRDCAVFADGSVSGNACTMLKII